MHSQAGPAAASTSVQRPASSLVRTLTSAWKQAPRHNDNPLSCVCVCVLRVRPLVHHGERAGPVPGLQGPQARHRPAPAHAVERCHVVRRRRPGWGHRPACIACVPVHVRGRLPTHALPCRVMSPPLSLSPPAAQPRRLRSCPPLLSAAALCAACSRLLLCAAAACRCRLLLLLLLLQEHYGVPRHAATRVGVGDHNAVEPRQVR